MSNQDGAGFQAVTALARESGRLAFDTEFMGEGRYRTLLCLVQLAALDTDGVTQTAIVDPLEGNVDGRAFAEALADPAIEVVVHAGRQDVALVRRWLGTSVTNVFDTQVAAGFAGLAAQASYDSLMSDVLGVRLAKSASYTRWDARPLSREQEAYAREDVVHLLELADELQRRLRERGRLDWARQECEVLERSSDERDPDGIFARLPRVRSLRPESRAVARELVDWRERTAARQDRPVQSILADAALVEVAKRRPTSVRDLEQIRGLHQSGLRRRGEDVIDAVQRGLRRPPVDLDEGVRVLTIESADAPLVALCESLARCRAREAGLAYELVAARADLQAIVSAWRAGASEPTVRTLQGWRRELVGAELQALLAGEIELSVSSEGRMNVSRRVPVSPATG